MVVASGCFCQMNGEFRCDNDILPLDEKYGFPIKMNNTLAIVVTNVDILL
jgi:hypothetical protein